MMIVSNDMWGLLKEAVRLRDIADYLDNISDVFEQLQNKESVC